MLDIEGRIQERTPYVVVALQEVRSVLCSVGFAALASVACFVHA